LKAIRYDFLLRNKLGLLQRHLGKSQIEGGSSWGGEKGENFKPKLSAILLEIWLLTKEHVPRSFGEDFCQWFGLGVNESVGVGEAKRRRRTLSHFFQYVCDSSLWNCQEIFFVGKLGRIYW